MIFISYWNATEILKPGKKIVFLSSTYCVCNDVRNDRLSCVLDLCLLNLCGDIISMPYSVASFSSSGSLSYALSAPIRRSGFSLAVMIKHLEIVASAKVVISCGEAAADAMCMETAGMPALLSDIIAMTSFVPLPRLVIPTPLPLFGPPRRCRRWSTRTDRARPTRADPTPGRGGAGHRRFPGGAGHAGACFVAVLRSGY